MPGLGFVPPGLNPLGIGAGGQRPGYLPENGNGLNGNGLNGNGLNGNGLNGNGLNGNGINGNGINGNGINGNRAFGLPRGGTSTQNGKPV